MKSAWKQFLWESIKGFPLGILFGVVLTFSVLGLFLSSFALNSMVMQTDIQKEIASAEGIAEALAMMYGMLTKITGFILGMGVLGSMVKPVWYYMAKILHGRVALQKTLVFTQKEGEPNDLNALIMFRNCYALYLSGAVVGIACLTVALVLVALTGGLPLASITKEWFGTMIYANVIQGVLAPDQLLFFCFMPILGIAFLETKRTEVAAEKDKTLIPKPKDMPEYQA